MQITMFRLLVAGILMSTISYSLACTTFAIPTDKNIYIGKTRDMYPDIQAIEVVVPKNQDYKYIALVSKMQSFLGYSFESKWVVRSGINQNNLAIVNMFGANLVKQQDKSIQMRYDDGDDFMTYVLTKYKTVDSVIKDLPMIVKRYNYPEFYTIADNKSVAYIEVADNNQFKVKYSTDKSLVHTNHYLIDQKINGVAITESTSSMMRFKRMTELLNSTNNYSITQLESFMSDHKAGDNTSILRIGSPVTDPSSPRTLAHFIAEIPKNDNPATVYIRLITTNQQFTLVLDSRFWKSFNKSKVISFS